MRVEDDNGDFAIAQNAQFVGLFHQAEFALRERNLKDFEEKKIANAKKRMFLITSLPDDFAHR